MSHFTTCPTCETQYEAGAGRMCPKCLLEGARHASPRSSNSPIGMTATYNDSPQQAAIMKPAQVDELFPELEVLDVIGHGGMGVVYKARQKNLGREVALKLLSSQLMDNPAFAERFSREARAMAMMNHPNIIAIYDFGQRGNHYYLVMEFVDGLNLRQLIAATTIEPAEAMQMVPQLCDALQYAHDRGIVHRDIKPENVLISQEGFVKIADFGLAKLTDGTPGNFTLTQSRQVMGTLNYMAPEQVEHPTDVDHRADIYSLGVVIYELLTGELPLGRFSPPSKKAEIDARLDEIVLRALEKEPALRYQQASEFKTGVQSVDNLPFVRHFGGTKSDQRMASRIAYFVWLALALTFCITGGVLIAIGAVAGIEDAIWIPGFVLVGTGGLLFALIGAFHSIFGSKQPEPPVHTAQASRGPRIAVVVSIISVLVILSLLGMKFAGAPPIGLLALPEVLIIGLVVFLGFLAIQLVSRIAEASVRPKPEARIPVQAVGGLRPLPNSLIALKCLGMVFFFACPVLFIAYGMLDIEILKFVGVVAPILGGFVMAIVGLIAKNKGYHDPDQDKQK